METTKQERGMPHKKKGKMKLKTYKERADYLSDINPMRADVYQGIADFFGHNEIPPKIKL